MPENKTPQPAATISDQLRESLNEFAICGDMTNEPRFRRAVKLLAQAVEKIHQTQQMVIEATEHHDERIRRLYDRTYHGDHPFG